MNYYAGDGIRKGGCLGMKQEVQSSNGRKWYAINTNPRSEDMVQSILGTNFEVFLPKIQVNKRRKKRRTIEPLFPGYLFVKLDLNASLWSKIKFTHGVRKILSFGKEPIPVPNKVMGIIRSKSAQMNSSKQETPFKQGDTVRFTDGPFRGLEGIFTGETAGKDRVKILLQTLYRIAPVEVSLNTLAKVG